MSYRKLFTIPDNLAKLSGQHRYSWAIILGFISALAMPPAYLAPLLFIAYPGLLWLLEGTENKKQSYFTGFCFGFGQYFPTLYWVTFAVFAEGDMSFWWVAPFAVLGIPLGLGFFTGFVTLIYRFLNFKGLAKVILFTVLWMIYEWIRGNYIFGGFPWNLIGYTWAAYSPIIQNTAWLGIYGLSFVTVFLACLPVLSAPLETTEKKQGAVLLTMLGIVGGLWGYGAIKLAKAEVTYHDNVMLRIVQPNIPQSEKWLPHKQWLNLEKLIELSMAPGPHRQQPTHIIWPETALTFNLNDYPNLLTNIFPPTMKEKTLITGNIIINRTQNGVTAYNSTLHTDLAQPAPSFYHKSHLVPFGEYIPFRKWLPMQTITGFDVDYSPAADDWPYTVSKPGTPSYSPLICFEAIFSGQVTNTNSRPQWLLNITNDAWFGQTAGPYQHLAMTRVRAIEEGLPLVRAAGTGISAVVDPYGRILHSLPLGQQGFMDVALPKPAIAGLYAQYRHWIFLTLIIIGLFTSIAMNKIGQKYGRKEEM